MIDDSHRATGARLGIQRAVIGAVSIGLLSSMILGQALATAPQAPTSFDWPQFHRDLGRTGYNPTETGLRTDTVHDLHNDWSFAAARGIGSSPTIVGNTVYFGSSDGNLYALNADTSQLVWSYPTGGEVYPSPAVANGRVYFGSADQFVYAVQADTGNLAWSYRVGPMEENSTIQDSPLVSTENDTVYIGVSSKGDNPLIPGRLLALSAATGELKWRYDVMPEGELGGAIWGGPSLDPGAGLVFFTTGNPDNAIIAVAWNTGIQRWKYQPITDPSLDLDFGVSPTVFTDANGHARVAAGGKNGVMDCLDELTGDLIWSFTASPEGSGIRSTAAYDPTNGRLIFGSAGQVQNTSGKVYALNAVTGELVWQVDTPVEVLSSPAIANGVVYVGYGLSWIARTGALLALDEQTGVELWRFDDNTPIWSSPAVTNGQVWVGGVNGKLYHFELPGGTPPPNPSDTATPTATGTNTPSPTNTHTPGPSPTPTWTATLASPTASPTGSQPPTRTATVPAPSPTPARLYWIELPVVLRQAP